MSWRQLRFVRYRPVRGYNATIHQLNIDLVSLDVCFQ